MKRYLVSAGGLAIVAAAGLAAFAQQSNPPVKLETIPVQGNVYMIAGAGGNIAVQVGNEGVLVVDTGLAGTSDAVLAEIRKLSDKPLQYILNTHFHPDHTGGNDAIRRAGTTITGANVTGNLTDAAVGAQIIAHLNVLNRMSAPTGERSPTPPGAWPTDTEFIGNHKNLFFNDESIKMLYQPNAHTDGDSLVWFRRSDVIATGDIFVTTSYPFIDVDHGGSIQGEIDALNNILDITVPRHEEEGGTYVIPGHGRVCDQWEVVEYRDMVTIVRDRVQAAIKEGKTLAQIKESNLTKDWDARYDTKTPYGGASQFIEAVYKSLMKSK
ncbi:MAG TPA: MBL fold metallo-hydrolase [Bryobacteraceae bacterium]|nr:MBL fold metallo-hydrolase [Bryobacteraceae bacterium]